MTACSDDAGLVIVVRNPNYGKVTMTITYSIWQGSNLLAIEQTASSAEEIQKVMDELNKLGKGFIYNVRKVETK